MTWARTAGPGHARQTIAANDRPLGTVRLRFDAERFTVRDNDHIGAVPVPPWTHALGWALRSDTADALAKTPLILHGPGTAQALSAAIAYTHGHVITVNARAGDGYEEMLASLLGAATLAATTGMLPGWARSGSAAADAHALLVSSVTPGIVPQRDYTLIITDPDLLDPAGAKTVASWCGHTQHGPTLLTGANAATVLAGPHPLARRAVAVHVPAHPGTGETGAPNPRAT
jgi:hypothetical protein